MTIQALINILQDIEVDARKAHRLVKMISLHGGGESTIESLEQKTGVTLVGVYAALRAAEAIKSESEKEESK
jgi:hypothetical protein